MKLAKSIVAEAAFDPRECKKSLFGADGGSGSYRCSQSIFQLDTLFNPDPSVLPSDIKSYICFMSWFMMDLQ